MIPVSSFVSLKTRCRSPLGIDGRSGQAANTVNRYDHMGSLRSRVGDPPVLRVIPCPVDRPGRGWCSELVEPELDVALALTLRSCRPSSPSSPGRAFRGRRVLDRLIAVLQDPALAWSHLHRTSPTIHSAPAIAVMTQPCAVFDTIATRAFHASHRNHRQTTPEASCGEAPRRKSTPAPWQASLTTGTLGKTPTFPNGREVPGD